MTLGSFALRNPRNLPAPRQTHPSSRSVTHTTPWDLGHQLDYSPEIRDFPKAIIDPSGRDLHDDTVTGLKNCTNLHSCTWTRDGSLTSDILTTFASLPKLRELEINGHDARYYDPKLFCRFTGLQKISVIMPSPLVVRNIRDMVKGSGEKLKSLTMICKVCRGSIFRAVNGRLLRP